VSLITSQSVVRLRAVRLRDDTGALVPQSDWVNASRLTIPNVSVQPRETSETRDAGGVIPEETWTLFSARGSDVDIQAGDRIEWRDRLLDVVGNPQRWHGLPSTTHHAEIILRATPPTRTGPVGVAAATTDAAMAPMYHQGVYEP
jgi:hypothetical protein